MKKQSLNPAGKKLKRIIIISVAVFLVLILGGTGLYFYLHRDTSAPLSDADFLVSVGTWEKSGASKVKWIFKEDGKGSLTTNDALNFYDFTWTLENGTLKIVTDWLYILEDEFSFTLNREEESFTVIAKEDEKESVFIKTTADSNSDCADADGEECPASAD